MKLYTLYFASITHTITLLQAHSFCVTCWYFQLALSYLKPFKWLVRHFIASFQMSILVIWYVRVYFIYIQVIHISCHLSHGRARHITLLVASFVHVTGCLLGRLPFIRIENLPEIISSIILPRLLPFYGPPKTKTIFYMCFKVHSECLNISINLSTIKNVSIHVIWRNCKRTFLKFSRNTLQCVQVLMYSDSE